jgi:serine/threonine protein kinase
MHYQKFLQLARRFFNTEAETLEKVGRHDQIPQLLAHFEQDKEFYLVQEFIKGQSLDEELSCGKRLGEAQVVDMIKDALGILNFIHSQGVIHRDIKPANIIRRQPDGRLVLIDFGAVKQLQTQILGQESHTVAIGTSGFAPPEQMLGQPVFSSDIYALGIIAIQAITGTPAQLLKPLTHEIVWRNYAQVRDRCAAILDKMVRYHVSERYSSAAEVLQDIQHL